MKAPSFTTAWVITADQVRSRSRRDRVPAALSRLSDVPTARPFERTAGDEIQAVLPDAGATLRAVEVLIRAGQWRVGVGCGLVETPLPASTRAGRGPAFVAAREAIERAHRSPQGMALRTGVVGRTAYARTAAAQLADRAHDVETCLWLLIDLWGRRTTEGWAVVDLLESGLTGRESARRLDISPSAVSQRAASARYVEGSRGRQLAERMLEDLAVLVARDAP